MASWDGKFLQKANSDYHQFRCRAFRYNLFNSNKGINLSFTHAVKETENCSEPRLSMIWWGEIPPEKFINNSGYEFPDEEKVKEMQKYAATK